MTNRILIVSTNLQFRALVGAELTEKGYTVEGAETIKDSLRLWTKEGKAPGLMLIEAQGQDFNESTLAILAELSRKTIVLVCTGAFDAAQVDFARLGVRQVIKPVTVGEIASEVAKLAGPP